MKDLLAIDIGSNTIKSLRVACVEGHIVELASESLPIRITKGTSLVDDAIDKISYAISHFIHSQNGEFEVRAVATSAMRTSLNSEDICRQVFLNTGVQIEVIAGEKEAYLSVLGAMYDESIAVPDEFVFMDLGGGSMELAYCRDKAIEKVDSFAIGAVRLTEMFIENPSEKIPLSALEKAKVYCKENLLNFDIKNKSSMAVGTGGAIAAAKYILETLGLKSFKESLTLSDLECLLAKISQEDVKSRIKNYAIPENRADIIPASFVCLIACMQEFSLSEMLYAKQSLRRGLCVEHFKVS